MKRVRRREGSRKGSGLGVHIEGLEARQLLDALPLFNEGTVDHGLVTWSMNSNGSDLVQLPSGARSYMPFAGSLYFTTINVLWKTDGTREGTVAVAGRTDAHPRVVWAGLFDGHLYYAAQEYIPSRHEEYGNLYRIDPTGKTETVNGIYGSLSPRISGGKLYVQETEYAPLRHRYFSVDGLTSTQLQGGLPSGEYPPPAPSSVTVGDRTFYGLDDGSSGIELWMDGPNGSKLVKDLFPGATSSSPNYFASINGRVVFQSEIPDPYGRSATVDGGVLFIGGGVAHESIAVHSTGGVSTVEITVGSNVLSATFNDSDFSAIYVQARGGDDRIDLSGAVHPASIYGGDGDDTIIGGTGNDEIDGGAGSDTLDYSAITESIEATQYRKILIGSVEDSYQNMESLLLGSGDDHASITSYHVSAGEISNSIRYIHGGAGDDSLSFTDIRGTPGGTAATVHGGEGDDRLWVDAGSAMNAVVAAYYFGDAGNDTFKMSRNFAFRDFNGGDGIDSVDYGQFSTAGGFLITLDDLPGDGPRGYDNVHSDIEIVYGTPWADTIIGSDKDETLHGGSSNDLLIGNGGNDSLFGYSGEDTLDGGNGNDILEGGDGIDTYVTDAGDTVVDPPASLRGSNLIIEGTNQGNTILVRPKSSDASVIQAIVDGVTTEFGASQVLSIQVRGYDGNDVMTIDPSLTQYAELFGGTGNDSLTGGGGNDRLIGEDGTDTVVAFGGNDDIESAETIYQYAGLAKTSLLGDVLRVYGTAGNDVIRVQRMPNSLNIEVAINGTILEYVLGGLNLIQIDALAGDDRIEMNSSLMNPTKTYSGAGNDTVLGGGGADRVYGGEGNDWIGGLGGNDILYGEAGNDRLFGGEGRDYIVGGLGADVIRGENGIDQLVAKNGEDDYRGNAGDVITLVA